MQVESGDPARVLRTPRAAGVAGCVFALLLAAVIVLVRLALPDQANGAAAAVADPSRRDALRTALALVPFGGVFFLWFMGAVRDYVGAREDRFFATLFLGSGLLFVAMLFALGASAEGLVGPAGVSQQAATPEGWEVGRHFTFTLLLSYGMRMAAVFTLSTTTIGRGLGLFPRWLGWFGLLVALVLLFVVTSVPWSELIFPAWVLVVSSRVFRSSFRGPRVPDAA
ncbi:hypothetical protein [Streptomyces sp. NPDC014733]|uniref:hypothetical protein n=1 Tax=Streptomyces sp. NPDC014733 TaxID=3364885 RepID=UPI0036F7EC93